jgi:ubiquinol-cytochrome c reductase cytochrome c1 subunit
MKKFATYLLIAACILPLTSLTVSAAGGANVEHSGVNINDKASLQRGAKLYVNYCLGCHAIAYMRYNRLSEDLGLSEEMVMENLVFSDAKFGETMDIAMDAEQAKAWFGKARFHAQRTVVFTGYPDADLPAGNLCRRVYPGCD